MKKNKLTLFSLIDTVDLYKNHSYLIEGRFDNYYLFTKGDLCEVEIEGTTYDFYIIKSDVDKIVLRSKNFIAEIPQLIHLLEFEFDIYISKSGKTKKEQVALIVNNDIKDGGKRYCQNTSEIEFRDFKSDLMYGFSASNSFSETKLIEVFVIAKYKLMLLNKFWSDDFDYVGTKVKLTEVDNDYFSLCHPDGFFVGVWLICIDGVPIAYRGIQKNYTL